MTVSEFSAFQSPSFKGERLGSLGAVWRLVHRGEVGKKKSSFQNLAISSTRFREWSHDYKRDIQPALLSLESGREGSRDGQRPGVSYPGPKPKLKHGSLMLYAAMQEGKSNGNRGVAVLNLEAASTWRDC